MASMASDNNSGSNSRHFSWFIKSCFPNPNDSSATVPVHSKSCFETTNIASNHLPPPPAAVSSLPDDLILECLSRVPSASLPSVSLVCRQWSRLLLYSSFVDLRRLRGHLEDTVYAVSATNYGLFAASFNFRDGGLWKVALFRAKESLFLSNFYGLLSHARLSAIGPRIYLIGRNAMFLYDTWSGMVTARSAMNFSRKKFANAVISGRIYVAGGAATTTAVEMYDPETDSWQVVAQSTRRRYGCIGAAVDGVFYVIGGLKIGGGVSGNLTSRAAGGSEAHIYASSMDMYDVEARTWLRSRAVPGGGCVVAACAAAGHIFVLASHAVELSFWKFDARRKCPNNSNRHTTTQTATKTAGFGEWYRIKSPPLPPQFRLDSTVRFSCVGVGETVVLIQVAGCIDDLLRRSGRSARGLKEGLVLIYETKSGDWRRGAEMPEVMQRAACVCVEC
ncbi:F-box/kelch-repeat protein At5g26960-like [Cucurbita moschata]|uniref:F-box/kelch-repeat protein At5g26960-like n=1 Tax=Cucurbita moschata TaxID=3662 RepID=A0A6J1H9C3_CUCMO|nr:F-box/kelch-repeat protein At5g26960-like [Cucurbita moschata]